MGTLLLLRALLTSSLLLIIYFCCLFIYLSRQHRFAITMVPQLEKLIFPWVWSQTKSDEDWVKFPHKVNTESGHWHWFCSHPIQFPSRIVQRIKFVKWGTTKIGFSLYAKIWVAFVSFTILQSILNILSARQISCTISPK